MLTLTTLQTKADRREFFGLTKRIYMNNAAHRGTEDDVIRILISPGCALAKRSNINPIIARDGKDVVGRFVLFHDEKLKEYVQIGFFEAMPGYQGLVAEALSLAENHAHEATRVVAGLGGHINYAAGFLLDNFDQTPAYGLPHSAEYYPGWFSDWRLRRMQSWSFPSEPFRRYTTQKILTRESGISVRFLNLAQLDRDVRIYSELNNRCFSKHPFWMDRSPEEDLELFMPFKPFLKPQNLAFAEKDGRAIGFFLWYPDFNQLKRGDGGLGLLEYARLRLGHRINRFRFTQIGVLPEFQASDASLRLISACANYIVNGGYSEGIGGFIFEENRESMALAKRFFNRALNQDPKPMASYGLFEKALR